MLIAMSSAVAYGMLVKFHPGNDFLGIFAKPLPSVESDVTTDSQVSEVGPATSIEPTENVVDRSLPAEPTSGELLAATDPPPATEQEVDQQPPPEKPAQQAPSRHRRRRRKKQSNRHRRNRLSKNSPRPRRTRLRIRSRPMILPACHSTAFHSRSNCPRPTLRRWNWARFRGTKTAEIMLSFEPPYQFESTWTTFLRAAVSHGLIAAAMDNLLRQRCRAPQRWKTRTTVFDSVETVAAIQWNDDGRLLFEWPTTATTKVWEKLTSYSIALSSGDRQHFMQLRIVQQPEPKSEPELLPIPDKDDQERAQALLDELFGERYRQAQQLPDGENALRVLADDIYSLRFEEDDPVRRFALLDMALQVATESGDPVLTTAIIDELSLQFEADDLALHTTAVNIWAKLVVKKYVNEGLKQKRLQLLDLIVPLAERAESEGRYREAASFYTLASKQVMNDRERREDLRKLGLALQNKAGKHAQMLKLAEELKLSGEDAPDEGIAEKYLTLGIYWCFELDDWEQGLIHLAVSSSEVLSEIAQLDLDSQTNPEDAEAVGDRWWDLKPSARFSKYKDQLKARATYWYALAIGDKRGLARKKLEKRIEEARFVLEAAPSIPANLTKGLVAYYPFNRNARDESGNENHGIVHGGATLGADRYGTDGKAYSFDGSNDYISASGNFPLGISPRSLTFWARPTKTTGFENIVGWGQSARGNAFGAYAAHDGGRNGLYFYGHGRMNTHDFSANFAVDSKWHQYSIIHNGQTIIYLVDGNETAWHSAPKSEYHG